LTATETDREKLAAARQAIEKLDPTLKHGERARKRIEFHIDKLRRKTGRTGPEAGLISARAVPGVAPVSTKGRKTELCLLPFLARWGWRLSELQKLATGKKSGITSSFNFVGSA